VFFVDFFLLKCVSSWQQQREEEKRQVNISTTAGAASAACQVTCNLWQANNKNKHELMLLTHVRAEHPNPRLYIYHAVYICLHMGRAVYPSKVPAALELVVVLWENSSPTRILLI